MDTLNEEVEQLEISEAEPQKEEIWKSIEGFENYLISSMGRFYNTTSRFKEEKDKYINLDKNNKITVRNKDKKTTLNVNVLMKKYFTEEKEGEIWKQIGNSNYSVSNYGNVKNHKKDVLLKNDKDFYNYIRIQLMIDGKPKNYLVHRLVAEAFIPNPDNLPEVHHIDKNCKNNNIDNLRWVTNLENTQSKNRNVNIGCVAQENDIQGEIRFRAIVTVNRKTYQKTSKNVDVVKEWLAERRNEIENDLPIYSGR
jgi:hypothetical protein